MFPRGYDYFRPVPAHVLIGARTLSPGNGSSSTDPLYPADVESGGLIECVICYNAIDTTNSPYMVRLQIKLTLFVFNTMSLIIKCSSLRADHSLRPPVPQGLSRAVAYHENGVLYLQVNATSSCGVSDYLRNRIYTVTQTYLPFSFRNNTICKNILNC